MARELKSLGRQTRVAPAEVHRAKAQKLKGNSTVSRDPPCTLGVPRWSQESSALVVKPPEATGRLIVL